MYIVFVFGRSIDILSSDVRQKPALLCSVSSRGGSSQQG